MGWGAPGLGGGEGAGHCSIDRLVDARMSMPARRLSRHWQAGLLHGWVAGWLAPMSWHRRAGSCTPNPRPSGCLFLELEAFAHADGPNFGPAAQKLLLLIQFHQVHIELAQTTPCVCSRAEGLNLGSLQGNAPRIIFPSVTSAPIHAPGVHRRGSARWSAGGLFAHCKQESGMLCSCDGMGAQFC